MKGSGFGMKKKINLQFIILTMIAILTTVSLSTFVFYELLKKEVIGDLKTYTQLMVKTDTWEIITDPDHADYNNVDFDLKNLRITLVSPDGTAVFDNNAEVGKMENHAERPEVIEAFQSGTGQAIRRSHTLGKNAFYYAIKLDNGYVLRVAKESSSITSVFLNAFPIMAVICVVLFVICLFLSHVLTRSLIAPIENLAENLDNSESIHVYHELKPFVETIRKQHADILRNANMRQEFTANVSHELKTPLTSISGYSELIESGMATDEDVHRFASEIHKNSNRLLTLINDIIRLSELDQMTREEVLEDVDLYEIAKNCKDMLKMYAAQHNVMLNLTGSSQHVTANRQMMDELIYNLCDNAIRYNNPGGSVDISVQKKEKDTVVTVRDTGIGISLENQERVFERFYRVDKSRSKSTGGTGLGLAIVKHIVAKHENTRLEMESEIGKGTTIRIIFTEIGA